MEVQHQIVLKLLECPSWVVDCQSELKLFCGNRDFSFLEPFKIHRQEQVEYEFGGPLLWN